MHVAAVVAACLCLVATVASAQYPARGNPDPAFNGGKLRVEPFTDPASGVDRLDLVVPLSSVRFAAMGARPNETLDFVAVIDTTPERVVRFDSVFEAGSDWETLWSLAPAGTAVVTGGIVARPGTASLLAGLQVREIGLHAVPTFTARATLVSASGHPQLRNAATTGLDARAASDGSLRIWQARTQFNDAFDCGRTILVRLDSAGAALSERGSVDLATLLSRTCVEVYYVVPHDRQPSDPPGADALVLAALCRDLTGGVAYVCVMRVLDQNGNLSIDSSFGPGGLAIYGAGGAFNYIVNGLRVDGAGRLVLAFDKRTTNTPFTQLTGMLLRLDAAGRTDASFGGGGTLDIPAGQGNQVTGLAITARGTVQAVGNAMVAGTTRPYVFYYDPEARAQQLSNVDFAPPNAGYTYAAFNAVTPLAAGGAFAVGLAATSGNQHALLSRLAGDRQTIDLVEYFHAAFGHYFLASVLAEIVKLDDGTFVGWERTGESFAAYPTGAAGADDVCRFFSATFAPRSSHFYTPIAVECEGLKTGGVWGYEGLVFALQNTPTGVCPAGARNLHRLYNDGRDGAPNHRYTVSDAIRRGQAAQGWTEEGNGTPPVFACLPT